MISPPIRTLIVDDEPLARRTLRSLITDTAWLECVGEAENGEDAIGLINDQRPELVFLDVQLPGASGTEVLSRTERDAVVIFTTAYDEYALIAFELGAIDYLKKPFGRERLVRAVERAVPQVKALRARLRETSTVTDGSSSLRSRVAKAQHPQLPIETIFVRDRGTVLPVIVADVQRFEADGDFVAVLVRGHRYLVYLNLGDLADQLDPSLFMRIHRSHIVNLAAVKAVSTVDANRAEVEMRDGSRVVASRVGTRALRQRMRNHNS